MSPEDEKKAAACLKTIAHPMRLRLIRRLIAERCTVGELAEHCGLAQAATSEHLRLMERCGLFTVEREGRRAYYRVAEPTLIDIMRAIEQRFAGA